MKLHELSNNKIALEETLKFFNKTEETDDGYITWCDGKGMPHLQVNMYNQTVYILTDHFKNLLDLGEKVVEERKKQFNPFYLEPKVKQVELGRKIEGKKSSSQEHTEEEEKPEKKQERLTPKQRLPNNCYDLDVTEEQMVQLECWDNEHYVDYKHYLSIAEPKYIDKYTTAYNSDIVRAILSHQ